MYARGCAQILRAVSCPRRLLCLSPLQEVFSSDHCWLSGYIRGMCLSHNKIFFSASRAFHVVGHPVDSHSRPALKVGFSFVHASFPYTFRESSRNDEHVPLDLSLLVADEYAVLADRLQRMIVAEVPKLATDAELFFKMWVKERRFQPTVLLLMAKAINFPALTQVSRHCKDASPMKLSLGQQCIPEIAEMLHIYDLVRHNMPDDANPRYHISSLNFEMGTKLSVLVGDFLLSKIFVTLASTKNSEVQSILLKVVEHLVIGETSEMTSSSEQLCSISDYLESVYNKKASLLANSCKAIAILSGKDAEVSIMAFNYGKYLGYAYQLMDDILDLAGRSATPSNQSSDIPRGMFGAPMLFAIEEFPQLRTIVDRELKNPSELDYAVECIKKSQGMQRTRELATKYAGLALEAIETLPGTNNKDTELSRGGLVDLAQKIIGSSQLSK